MHNAIQAATNVDDAEQEAALDRFTMELKTENARDTRQALATSKNGDYANAFAKGIADRTAEIERLFDQQVVELADIETTMEEKINNEARVLGDLVTATAASRERLANLERGKTQTQAEKREHYAKQIAAARTAIRAFEAGSAELAKEA